MDNIFGALRLLLASLVILSHSPVMIDGDRSREPLTMVFGTITFGEFAVDGFFLLSGYLITASYLSSRSLKDYLIKRALRIYPAFLVCFAVCYFGFAPFVMDDPATLLDPSLLISSLVRALLFQTPMVPGVFPGFPIGALNVAVWSIGWEVGCYLLVALLGAAGLYRSRNVLAALTATLIGLYIAETYYFLPGIDPGIGWISYLEHAHTPLRLMAAFLCGQQFFLYRDAITYRHQLGALACGAVVGGLFSPVFAEPILWTCGGYVLFWAGFRSTSALLKQIGTKTDLSYGVYLYAWPVQKSLVYVVPGISPWTVSIVTLFIVSGLAWLSWTLVEKPALGLKSRLLSSTIVPQPGFGA